MAAQDQPVSRQGSAEGTAKTEAGAAHAVTGVVKEVATTTPGEDFGRNGTSSGDQWMNNNTHLAMSHQVAPENALPATGTSAIAGSDPLRTVQAEQIVSQVKDHLAGRDIKSGVEQVVIRLSPENLGELKMSLRMENQCLKVEIVAETSMVRDALMKHSDTLKESLARQNISMESFDVSTGSNRFGSASQGQGDWRELARQRQSNVWTSAGGYRLDTVPEVPLRPLYQASATHSMVDMHF
jgi:flagellar hook-length control protein FliK